MRTLQVWFARYGGLASWLFLIGLLPQVWTNFTLSRYTSGSLGTWGLYIAAYGLFGLYMAVKDQKIVALGQFIGCALCILIVLQSLIFPHAQ